MTLDYTKMFLIVTEEAVVKGHFTCRGAPAGNALRTASGKWLPRPARPVATFARRIEFKRLVFASRKGRYFLRIFGVAAQVKASL